MLVLFLAGVIAVWVGDYAPLRTAMTQRFQESQGGAAWQVRERETAARRAAEEAAKQRAQEDDQERKTRQHGQLVAEYRRIVQAHQKPIGQMLGNIGGVLRELARVANDPSFYRNGYLSPEETSSRRGCGDPAGAMDLMHRNAKRDRNIFACAVFLALNSQGGSSVERNVTMALLQRVTYGDETGHYPFQTVVAYVWISALNRKIDQAEDLPPIPDLTVGDDLNPQLFGGVISPGFARRLIETATVEEKLSLRTNVYQDLRRLSELGAQIVQGCRVTQRNPCLRDG